MPYRTTAQHTDHRRIFAVSFDLQVVHSDSLDVPMKNGSQNQLNTKQ